jgi:hypothetical protein
MMHETLSMQRSIRLRHAPPHDWCRRSQEYAQEVYVYLGLATESAPLVSQHRDDLLRSELLSSWHLLPSLGLRHQRFSL